MLSESIENDSQIGSSQKTKNPEASPSQRNTVTVTYSSNSFPTLPAKGDEVIFLDKENSGLFRKGTVLSAKKGREMDRETYETRGIVKLQLSVKESAGRK